MKLFQLNLLKTLYYNGMSVSRAAEQHFVVQSAVSRQLSLLEEELGMPLFERKGKRLVEPTPLCSALIGQVESLDQTMDNIRAIADDFRLSTAGEIKIATTHTQARYFLPKILLEFRKKYPDVNIHLLQGNPEQLVEMLRDGVADIAVCTEVLATASSVESHKCYSWNHALVVPKQHVLADSNVDLTLKKIAQHPILTYVFGFTGRSKIQDSFRESEHELNVSFAATDTDVILNYVRLGFGAGIIAKMAYSHDKDDDLVLRDLSHLFPSSTTRVGWLKTKFLKQYVSELVDLLITHGKQKEV